jgi:hypothetical protein
LETYIFTCQHETQYFKCVRYGHDTQNKSEMIKDEQWMKIPKEIFIPKPAEKKF